MKTPLDQIRVLDLTRLIPGAMCTLMLADQGAEVIKVEQPGSGDYMRWFLPRAGEYAAAFHALNRNKRSITLDLKRGRAVFVKLAENADVIIEGYRPGVMARLGIAYDDLKDINPGLVMCSLSGYGQEGPMVGAVGHDLNYSAIVGISAAGKSDVLPIQAMDFGGAYLAAFAIVTALFGREATGEGCYIDAALIDPGISLMTVARAESFARDAAPQPSGELLTGGYACYHVYHSSDRIPFTLAAIEEKFWRAFCSLAGRDDLAAADYLTPEAQPDLIEQISAVFAGKSGAEWESLLAGTETCTAPVINVLQSAQHPGVKARDALYMADGVAHTYTPFKMGARIDHRPAPGLGADTDALLREAGFVAEDIKHLREKEII